MAKIPATAIIPIIVVLLGVFFFVGAVSGLFFARATPLDDIGAWTVLIAFVALGLLGFWAAMAEDKQKRENRSRGRY